jgi:hypothetical protein
MNIALAALIFLAASRDEDYIDDNENKPKNEDIDENENKNKNKSMDYSIDRPPAAAE